ncbi:hypothetical protein FOZ63_016274 [Perkinsus olseni]|uniref:Uncharacterized protein n=1 Tax=Perkinsus olseni TaxID=32597 RepID=A0A7J6RL25_PEROL|nr:hypothetical protein FOZ60_006847 [Perkinsus olseni]KAF4720440.1 hypothetical protein FOZ63_016274 [Perkinsus olseni]KAF4739580.1 hypothetical protein FOZ62_002005 [Perkinsus olseni]
MLFIGPTVLLLLIIITLVGGIDTPQKDTSNATARMLYPFVANYYDSDNTPVKAVLFTKSLGGTVTFYRVSPQSLPKPTYACGYTAKQGGILTEIELNNGCLPLIHDSHGSYDRTLLTGIRIRQDYSVLTIPKADGTVDTYTEFEAV